MRFPWRRRPSGPPLADRIRVVHNGVDTTVFSPDAGKIDLGLSGRIVLGWVGTFDAAHGPARLCSRIHRLLHLDPRLYFVFVGDGDGRYGCEAAIPAECRPSVRFTGMVPHEDVPRWINAFDMAFHVLGADAPEFRRGWSIKAGEYLACGKPIICDDVGRLGRLARERQLGEVFFHGFDEASYLDNMMMAILDLAANAPLRVLASKNARDFALEHLTWTEHVRVALDGMLA